MSRSGRRQARLQAGLSRPAHKTLQASCRPTSSVSVPLEPIRLDQSLNATRRDTPEIFYRLRCISQYAREYNCSQSTVQGSVPRLSAYTRPRKSRQNQKAARAAKATCKFQPYSTQTRSGPLIGFNNEHMWSGSGLVAESKVEIVAVCSGLRVGSKCTMRFENS